MILSKLKLITFDATGTIIRPKKSPGVIYAEVGEKFCVESDINQLNANFKSQWKLMCKKHPIFGKNGIGWEQWWKKIVRGTFNDDTINPEKLEYISNHLIDCFKGEECWMKVTGVVDVLSFLNKQDVCLGVVSNSDDRLVEVLKNFKMIHFFDFVLTSYSAGFEKPDARIFQKALLESKIKNLQPNDCLHIGDTIELDLLGAKKAGWNGLIISDMNFDEIRKKYPSVRKEEVFPSLVQIDDFLRRW